MKSDEIVTGSAEENVGEHTPDTEVKEMGNEAEGKSTASAGTANSEVTDTVPRKPNLTKEQQEWLNKVFIPNFRKELMRQVQFDRKLLEQHKRELERRKSDEELQKTALQAAQEEKERLTRTISELRIDKALVTAAAANNAINPDQVRQLLKDRVKLGEDLEPMVLDEKGERQLNQNGEFMSVEEQVRAFLSENPHLVKPSPARSGGGSVGSGPATRGFAVGATTSGDLISEGLAEESTKPPTRTLADFEEK